MLFVPPFAPEHVQDTEAPCAGKEGFAGLADPEEHNEPEYEVWLYAYVFAAGPQEPFTGAASRVAEQDTLAPSAVVPSAPHVQFEDPPCAGKETVVGLFFP